MEARDTRPYWECTLYETGEGARYSLGTYQCKTREDALARAGKKYRSLVRKFQTGRFTVDALPCEAPTVKRMRKPKPTQMVLQ